MPVTESSPFPGAATCYSRAYKLLRWMAESGHVRQVKNGRKTVRCEVSEDMADLIAALNRGDESTIKATLLSPRFFAAVHSA